jgi:hypothetical protein
MWFGVQGMYTALWLGNVLKWQSGKQRRLEHIIDEDVSRDRPLGFQMMGTGTSSDVHTGDT